VRADDPRSMQSLDQRVERVRVDRLLALAMANLGRQGASGRRLPDGTERVTEAEAERRYEKWQATRKRVDGLRRADAGGVRYRNYSNGMTVR